MTAAAAAAAAEVDDGSDGGGFLFLSRTAATVALDFFMASSPTSMAVSLLAGVLVLLILGDKRRVLQCIRSLWPSSTSSGATASSSPTLRKRRSSSRNSPAKFLDVDDTEDEEQNRGAKKSTVTNKALNDSDSQAADDEEEVTTTDATPLNSPTARPRGKGNGTEAAAVATAATGLSRRQKKNRRQLGGGAGDRREEPCPSGKKKKWGEVLRQYEKLDLSDEEIYHALLRYLHDWNSLRIFGFPMASALYPGKACILCGTFEELDEDQQQQEEQELNPNAEEFKPRSQRKDEDVSTTNETRNVKGNGTIKLSPSGHLLSPTAEVFVPKSHQFYVSGDAAPNATALHYNPAAALAQQHQYDCEERALAAKRRQQIDPSAKTCMRCQKTFYVCKETGVYLRPEKCLYHWGKLHRSLYHCCGRPKNHASCTEAKLHVWKGVEPSEIIHYYNDFVMTRQPRTAGVSAGVYAMDAEMAFTASGLELVRLTVVGLDGRLVYEAYVRPDDAIIDYNTRFSGLSARDLDGGSVRRLTGGSIKTLREVQNDLMGFLTSESILVGHGLENDLRVLRLVHMNVIDTALVFIGEGQLRYSLKVLAKKLLGKDIQTSDFGHDSKEDATTCMELILWKVRNDRANI